MPRYTVEEFEHFHQARFPVENFKRPNFQSRVTKSDKCYIFERKGGTADATEIQSRIFRVS